MAPLRRHRRAASLFAWLALLAIALLPTLSRALVPAAGPGSLAEVCTPQGLQRLPPDAPAPRPVHGEACVLCALGAADVLPAPAAVALRAPRLAVAALALPTGLTPARQRDWRQAPPRAPPAA